MQAAMMQASLILITHEHLDHIGGLAVHPDLQALLARTKLTREQIAEPERIRLGRVLADYVPLEYEKYRAIAPGVVLIKAPGHTPGSQMVYVRCADGAEFLFIGDVAWQSRNIEMQRERARLVTWLWLEEDRDAVLAELVALKRLSDAQPAVHIIPGHDGARVGALLRAGALRKPFDVTVEH